MARLRAALRHHLPILALYALLALIIIGRNPLMLFTHFIGSDTGDTYEMARNIWWFTYAIRNGEPLYTQTFLGFPDGIDGRVLMTVPLQYFPMWLLAFVLPTQIAYNFVVLLYVALNGWAMYTLMRYLLAENSHVPAFVAGLVYMSFPVFQGHLAEGHAGLMVAWAAPLYILFALRLVDAKTGVWRWMALSCIFFYLSTTGHILQAIYVLIPVTVTLSLWQIWRGNWSGLIRIFVMGAISSGLMVALLLPALRSATTYSEEGGYVRYSIDFLTLATPSFFNPVVDSITDYPRAVLGTNLGEGAGYIGIVVGALILIGLMTQKRSRRWLLLATIAWVLALGSLLKVFDQPVQLQLGDYSTYIALPFAFVQNLPGFELARTPARFMFGFAIAIGVLAGYGTATLWRPNGRTRWAILGILLAFFLFENNVFWGMPLREANIPQAIEDLQNDDSARAIFNIPHEHLLAAKDALYLQTAHEKPLIAGQITRQTPVNPAKLDILQETLNPLLLRDAGADIVILHKQYAQSLGMLDELNTLARENLNAPIYEDDRFAIFRVPRNILNTPYELPREWAGTVNNQDSLSFYIARPTWVDVSSIVQANGRDIQLSLDDVLVHRGLDVESTNAQLSLYFPRGGYHTLTWQGLPQCPENFDNSVLQCLDLSHETTLTRIRLNETISAGYEDGIRLLAGDVRLTDTIEVRLHWEFTSPRSDLDVRFVHVVDTNNQIVAQLDTPLGEFDIGNTWAETIIFPTENLPKGDYLVQAGWYFNDGVTLRNYETIRAPFTAIGTITVE